MLLPLRGVGVVWVPFTQGAALGYVLLLLRGVLFMSFDTPSSYDMSSLPVRRPIGLRPPSDQIPFAVRLDGGRDRWLLHALHA